MLLSNRMGKPKKNTEHLESENAVVAQISRNKKPFEITINCQIEEQKLEFQDHTQTKFAVKSNPNIYRAHIQRDAK